MGTDWVVSEQGSSQALLSLDSPESAGENRGAQHRFGTGDSRGPGHRRAEAGRELPGGCGA